MGFKHPSALLKSSFQLHTYIKLYHSCNSSFRCHLQASFFLSVTNTRWFYLLSCLFFLSSFLHELEGRKTHPWEVSGLPSSFLPHSTVARFCYCCISTMFATLFALKKLWFKCHLEQSRALNRSLTAEEIIRKFGHIMAEWRWHGAVMLWENVNIYPLLLLLSFPSPLFCRTTAVLDW